MRRKFIRSAPFMNNRCFYHKEARNPPQAYTKNPAPGHDALPHNDAMQRRILLVYTPIQGNIR